MDEVGGWHGSDYLKSVVNGDPDADLSESVPERNLLAAIVERAMLDTVSKDRRHKADAKQWLFESIEDCQFSFCWICKHMGWDIKEMRAGIQALTLDGGWRALYSRKKKEPNG